MESINEIVQNNIKRYRKLRKMTQKALAEALDVTHSSVSAWEIGKNAIDIDRLCQICNVLDVGLPDVLSDSTDAEQFQKNEENRKIIDTINRRPEVKRLMLTTFDSRNDDIVVAIKLLEALKRR
ncbi:MAG: helix-turn-helix transcriptional regulator [Eubacteriales bacterium]|nr:helix-turn-helix transcriptional regulator [Eubacteriales bacterium]MDD3199233.1 helix-turn-helix transcriptional regulator [Eubacteriales bacterium]MDD4122546.1 helix-turn-helix transcriptional regulator [Eubacteriales bacterium]MDD4629364.1 helix-turn-helix transcriptional regulator [Eubacteriales bacterium]